MAVTATTAAEIAAAGAVQQQQPWIRGGLCRGVALGLVGSSLGVCPHSICTNVNSPNCTVRRTANAWAVNLSANYDKIKPCSWALLVSIAQEVNNSGGY